MAVVMGVLIVSFGVWGIADIFKGFGQSKLAKIGSTEISIEAFRQIYNDRLQQLSRQFGRPLTQEQARLFGLGVAESEMRTAQAKPHIRAPRHLLREAAKCLDDLVIEPRVLGGVVLGVCLWKLSPHHFSLMRNNRQRHTIL